LASLIRFVTGLSPLPISQCIRTLKNPFWPPPGKADETRKGQVLTTLERVEVQELPSKGTRGEAQSGQATLKEEKKVERTSQGADPK